MSMKTNSMVVYNYIKKKILTCEYEPGQLVSEKEIVEELKTSRTPVRESLNILNGEGLLRIIPKKGVQISPLSTKKMKQIYEIRTVLEPLCIKQAIENIKPTDIDILIQLNNDLVSSLKEMDLAGILKFGMDIHLYIAQLSGNDTLYMFLKILREESYRGYIYYLKQYSSDCSEENNKIANRISTYHSNLIEALKEKDTEASVKFILEDLQTMNCFLI